jgi:hypothetical protein
MMTFDHKPPSGGLFRFGIIIRQRSGFDFRLFVDASGVNRI